MSLAEQIGKVCGLPQILPVARGSLGLGRVFLKLCNSLLNRLYEAKGGHFEEGGLSRD